MNMNAIGRAALVVALGVLSACATTSREPQLPPFTRGAEVYEFRVGDFRAVALLDGTHAYRAEALFANAPAGPLADALQRHGVADPAKVTSTFTCLALLDTRRPSAGWILLDTGIGSLTKTGGRLQKNLSSAGISPADVRTIVITHGHPDHISGIVGDDGSIRFPNARYVIGEREWQFWTGSEIPGQPKSRVEVARKQFGPVRDRVTVVASDAEIAPGVRLQFTPGHTPGHAIVNVQSRGERLIFWGDLVLHAINLEEPEWRNTYDADAAEAAASRRRLLDDIASTNTLVLAYHFADFPSLGYVKRTAHAWSWVPAGHAAE